MRAWDRSNGGPEVGDRVERSVRARRGAGDNVELRPLRIVGVAVGADRGHAGNMGDCRFNLGDRAGVHQDLDWIRCASWEGGGQDVLADDGLRRGGELLRGRQADPLAEARQGCEDEQCDRPERDGPRALLDDATDLGEDLAVVVRVITHLGHEGPEDPSAAEHERCREQDQAEDDGDDDPDGTAEADRPRRRDASEQQGQEAERDGHA